MWCWTANHPLAGMSLRMAIKVRAVRPATDDEIEARSVTTNPVALMRGAAKAQPNNLH